ncbi:MAG TPA: SGNH/GDSL hydrolase family protein [Candidatus Aquilonibacter sp.]|nr:SGNH/GDSL hydrolase family protein [Candidatus Aquilonibacter sp.]
MRIRLAAAVVVGLLACAVGARGADRNAKKIEPHWVATWATSQVGPEPSQPQLTDEQLTDTTVRQIVHLSIGGTTLRVQLSNAFGTRPLRVDSVHVARAKSPASSAIDVSTDHAVTFQGSESVVIPTGAVYVSDPIAMQMDALSNLAISFHYAEPPSVQTSHPGSRATSYLLHGEHSTDAELVGAEKTVRWLGLAEVDTIADDAARTVIALGDSITDGHAATTDGNDRWTDELARRVVGDKKLKEVAVVNEGIGGNHLLTNGLGESVLERFDRDVLAVSGVRYVIVLEGINDLGGLGRRPDVTQQDWNDLVRRMEGALEQIVVRAHAHAIYVYGCTIMPDGGGRYYNPDAMANAARQQVNAWIMAPGHFDGVLDMDKVTQDPANPLDLNPKYDSGDHLHPGPVGYKAMGDAIPLDWFR